MTTSTRAINAAAGVIHAAMQQGRTLPQTIAYALDSAGLLNSPEIAAELEHLRKRVAELEAAEAPAAPYLAPAPSCARCYGADALRWVANGGAPTDCPVCGHSAAVEDVMPEALIASSGAVIEVRPIAAREERHDSPLHHTYAVPRDLPEMRP